jgi:nucleotide-binding universal stress UspA family protein
MATTDTRSPRFVLLVAVDESPAAARAIARAAWLARATPGAEIHLVHAADPLANANSTDSPYEVERHRMVLDERSREAQAASGVTVIGHLLETDPVSAILRTAAGIDADLVVVGTRDRHGPERWLLGSVAQKVMQRAACPVLVERAKDHVASHAPEIEPPCDDCLAEQRASGGARLWCARHSTHHPRGHLHFEMPQGFGAGSSLLRP